MAARGTVELPYSYEFTITGTGPEFDVIFDPPLTLRSNTFDSWLGFGGFHAMQKGCIFNRVNVECTLIEGGFAPKNSPTKVLGSATNDGSSFWKQASEGKKPWIYHKVTTNRISKLKINITPTKQSSKKSVDEPTPPATSLPPLLDGKEIKIYFRFINRGQQSKPNEYTFKEPRYAELDQILKNPFLEKRARAEERKLQKMTISKPQPEPHPVPEAAKTPKRKREENLTNDTPLCRPTKKSFPRKRQPSDTSLFQHASKSLQFTGEIEEKKKMSKIVY